MEYNIVTANEKNGQLQIAYKDTTGKVVGIYAFDVPILDGVFLNGDALHNEIVHRAPIWATEREQEVMAATGFEEIAALVQPLPEEELDSEAEANARMWEQTQFEQRIAAALVKFGVLQSDPTAIPIEKL